MPDVRIPISRVKIAMISLLTLAFTAGGLGMLSISLFGPAVVWTTAAIGLAAAVYFGPITVWAVRKLFDSRPALLIDSEGIVDNSSGIAAGRIPWSEVTAISTSLVVGQRFVNVHVVDPERFISQGTRLQRFFRRRNMELVGTPISISPNGLAVKFDRLEAAIMQGFEKHGRVVIQSDDNQN